MPKLRAPKKVDPAFVVGDVVAIAHCMVALTMMVIGESTPLLNGIREKNPGVAFLYKYLDKPVYSVISQWFDWLREYHDLNTYYLGAIFVVVTASVFYGVVAFVVIKVIMLVFGIQKR